VSKVISERERFADNIYLLIQLFSSSMFIITGLIGWILRELPGLAAGVMVGFLTGRWMLRSIGKRGRDPFKGYYIRMRERAQGSRPGLLESLIEKIRGNAFNREKCLKIADAFDASMERVRSAVSMDEQREILVALSETTKRISYEKNGLS
jgi:hypothetical protein